MPTLRNEIAIWERILRPMGKMSRETAREILELEFPPDEIARMHELSARNREGKLLPGEEEELDYFCRVGNTLSLLKSRARQILKPSRRAS
jgi:hypothetical protein